MEGLKSQHVQDFIITQIRNEKTEQQRDIPVHRLLEIVKTVEDADEDEDLDDEDDEEEELNFQTSGKESLNENLQSYQQPGGSRIGHDKDVEIKREVLNAADDEFSRSYTQQYPMAKAENFPVKFATLSAKLRSERTQLSCELCSFKCLSKVLLSSHQMLVHNHESKVGRHSKCELCQAVFLTKIGLETHQVKFSISRCR